jgi:SAM-dependent methyltransferase
MNGNNISRALSPIDAMYEGNPDHYFGAGKSALTNIKHAVSIANINPQRILDFGCGAGRVTRWIAAEFPQAKIEGCDIRPEDIEFVGATFEVQTWRSEIEIEKLNPPSTYDLIWVGSVFTHLSDDVSAKLFEKMVSWLNPRGVMVLSSHGRYAAGSGHERGFYGIKEQWGLVRREFENSRFGYADYPETPGYGISLAPLAWWANLIASRSNVRLILMTEQAWDDHHDVIAVQRR